MLKITRHKLLRQWLSKLANWLAFGGVIVSTNSVVAQSNIVPDNTLGTESSIVTPNIDINGIKSEQISGGAIRGINLFHSFQEFNIKDGRGAYFTNPTGVENILSRVTGGKASSILGKLGVLGNANLFLINPNGIIFGENAFLDIRGSFVGSTASSVKFADGTQFSAIKPETPLLTISVPNGLQLGTNNSGTINSAGNLTVGQNLTLAATNLDLQGKLQAGENLTLQAEDTARLTDSANNPLIAKAGSNLILQGNQAIDIFALNHSASGLFSGGDMILRAGKTVAGDAHYITGGNFRIEQLDGKLGSLFSPYDPVIRASGDVTFDSYTGASLHILAGGSVNIPGNISITGRDTTKANSIIENVTLSDGATVVAINGNTQPTVDIRAGTNAFGVTGITGRNTDLSGGIPDTNEAATSADMTIGSIKNKGGVIFLTTQYKPNTSLVGGAIQVRAINTNVASGNAGSIIIDSRGSIKLTDRTVATVESGNSGEVTLKAINDITTSTIATFIGRESVGNGGNISLTTTQGAIDTTAGDLNAGTIFGNGGTITLQAKNNITTANLSSHVTSNGIGNGGDISLTTTQGAIDTTSGTLYSSSGDGNAGNITLNAAESITTGNTQSLSRKKGNGGDISLTSTQGAIDTTSGTLNSSSRNGDAGAVTIDSRSSITTGKVESVSFADGNGGAITLKAQNDIITTGDILTSARKPRGEISTGGEVGNSGNISLSSTAGAINTTRSSLDTGTTFRNGGTITLNAYKDIATGDLRSYVVGSGKGNGGNIFLTSTQGAIDTTSGTLNSLSGDGNAGAVTIDSRSSITTGKVESVSFANGNGGAITLKAQDDIITTGDILTLARKPRGEISTGGEVGNSGDISLSSTAGAINTTRSSLNTRTTFRNGGTITLNAYKDIATGDLRSDVVGSGRGNGGNISLTSTAGAIDTTLGLISSYSDSDGIAGNITLNAAGNITAGDIQSSSIASKLGGAGGNINLTTNADVYIENSRISAITRGSRKGGDINITARSLFVTKGAELNTSTSGDGIAGNVTITARERVSFDGGQKVFTLESLGSAPDSRFRFLRRIGENVRLDSQPSTLSRWSIDEVSDGIVTLKSQSYVPGHRFLDGRTADKDTEVGLAPNTKDPFTGTKWKVNQISNGVITLESQGSIPGDRFLDGRTVDGTVGLAPNTNDPFTGTRWKVNESGFISSKIYSRVEAQAGAEARAGNINITTGSLSATNGAFLSVGTDGIGNAGNVIINARDSISLDGIGLDRFPSGLYSGTLRDAKGQGGSLSINTERLVVKNGASVSANSLSFGNAGSLRIEAGSIELDNQGKLRATTVSGEGGNIDLQVRDLILMRRQSLISAQALNNATGGNITIKTPLGFIVTDRRDNSDIVAKAAQGRGGRIDIQATGVYGFENYNRNRGDRYFSNISDINASSGAGVEFDGTIDINIPETDPNSGFVNLPVVPVDTNVAQVCSAGGSTAQSRFTITGRGGLPANPGESLSTDAVQVDLVTLNPKVEQPSITKVSTSTISPVAIPIVEATRWVKNTRGEIVLTATPTTAQHGSWQKKVECGLP